MTIWLSTRGGIFGFRPCYFGNRAIELDDKSHNRSSRKQRDAFVTELCRNIGLPLLRIAASKTYSSLPEIRVKVLEATQRNLEPLLTHNPPPAPRSTAPSRLEPTLRLRD